MMAAASSLSALARWGGARFEPETEEELSSGGLELPYTAVCREVVGPSGLRREDVSFVSSYFTHGAAGFQSGGVTLLGLAFGPPRLWGYLLDTAFASFQDGYWQAGELTCSSRMHQGMRAATHSVHASVDALLDRCGADIALLALTREQATLQVQVSGPLHAYVVRRRGLRRLGSRRLGILGEASAEGLLTSEGTTCTELLEAGDLVFAGSRRVCHDSVVQRICRMVERDRAAPPQAVLDLLSASATERGFGAATLAFRVPG